MQCVILAVLWVFWAMHPWGISEKDKVFLIRFLLFSCRYIRSERSVILINFCLSIISSNALILIGQTQTRNKVRNHLQISLVHRPAMQSARFPTHDPAILLSLSRPVVSGLMHPDRSVSSFLLLVLILLGSDRSVAVLHGSDRPPQESHYTQAFPVSRLGWAFSLLSVMVAVVFFF